MRETIIKVTEQKFKFLAGLILIIFLILVIRLWVLQIMQGASVYMVKSKENQTRIIRINAPRGIFYDRNGKILVSSRISHNVLVVPEDIKNKPEIITKLSKILNISETEIREKLKPNPRSPRNPYQYIPICKDIDPVTTIKLYEAKLDLPGVEVDEVPLRSYNFGEFASHLFGYIREIDTQELKELKDKGYRLGDLVGKTGLERTYEDELRGIDGGKIFEVDIHGRPLRLLEYREPIPGNNLHLTIDQRVQAAAEKALDEQLLYLQKHTKFRNAKAGAVIALDPSNGNILAMVSKPAFDPNLFVGVIPPEAARKLYNNPLHPFMNRVIQGEFAPGSTFKPIVVFSALMENLVTEKQRFYCGGIDPVWGTRFPCWIFGEQGKNHGWQTVVEGLKNSCNIVMAELCRKTGPDILAKYARYFGFGRPTGINLYPRERLGLVPDPEWKMKNTREKEWYPLETLHFGIGQGYLTVTPLQLAQLYAAIGNYGRVYRPQLVSKITAPSGEVLRRFRPRLTADLRAPRQVYSILQQGLAEVVSEGTAAWAFKGFPLDRFPVAGKTGTVQKPPYDNSGVFACYAPSNKPEIVVIVLIEQGGSGSGAAAPVARKILEAYFKLDEKPSEAPEKQSNVTPSTVQNLEDGPKDKPEAGSKIKVLEKPDPGETVSPPNEAAPKPTNVDNLDSGNSKPAKEVPTSSEPKPQPDPTPDTSGTSVPAG